MGKIKEPLISQQKPSNNTWVFLHKDEKLEDVENKDDNLDIVALKHPGSGKKSMFLFNKNNTVQEILSFEEPKRSWFIDNTVVSNGNLYLSTPMDPLFLVLPYLQQHCSTNAAPLEQVLKDAEFPEVERLLECCSGEQLSLIADRRGSLDLNAHKYNEEKVLSWLTKKVESVTKVLKDKKIHVGFGAVSATFVKSEKCDSTPEVDYKKYAFGIVMEYVSIDLYHALRKHLSIPEETESHKRKSSAAEDNGNKKIKLENVNKINSELNNYLVGDKLEKLKMVSAKEKAWVKAASGTKSISSFFKKK